MRSVLWRQLPIRLANDCCTKHLQKPEAKLLDSRDGEARYSGLSRISHANIRPDCGAASMQVSQPFDDDKLTFTLIGSERDKGFVRLADLAEFLDRLLDCLRETERCILGKKPSLAYIIQDMHVGSPASGTVSAPPSRKGPDVRRTVFGCTRATVASLQHGSDKLDPRYDHDAKLTFRKLGEFINASDERARKQLILNQTVVTSQLIASIDKALEIQESSYGTVTGRLEKIDVHGRNQFAIFPTMGGPQVTCSFDDELLEQVQASLKKHVTVSGNMYYVADRLEPLRVEADDIDIHPPAEELPKLTKMAGRLSHISGDSVTLARKIRDGWDE